MIHRHRLGITLKSELHEVYLILLRHARYQRVYHTLMLVTGSFITIF